MTASSDPRRLAKGESVELVVSELRDAILEGRLPPGARIYQQAVASELGTSRLPVREALRELQNEGLVVLLPNSGARVARLDAGELDEIYWLRERLEPAVLAQSVPHLDAQQVEALRRAVAELESVAETDPGRWLDVDRDFHLRSLAAAPLPQVLRLLGGFWKRAIPYRRAFLGAHPEAVGLAGAEHRLLLDAIERRSAEDAAALLEVHIRRTRLGLAATPGLLRPGGAQAGETSSTSTAGSSPTVQASWPGGIDNASPGPAT